jgi:hypothetical protein
MATVRNSTQIQNDLIASIYENTVEAISGQVLQDRLTDMAVSYINRVTDKQYLNLQEFSASRGYDVGECVMYVGTLYQCTTAHTGAWNAANFTVIAVAGAYLPLSGGTMTGNILFSGGVGIDTTATGGTDTLNIGITNADAIVLGRTAGTVSVPGSATFTKDATVNTLTVGLGAGSVATNTVVGYQALNSNTTGSLDVTVGYQAMYNNTIGQRVIAIGYQAMYNAKAMSRTVAIGYLSQYYANDSASNSNTYNVAVGDESLKGSATPANNTGTLNTAIGGQAMFNNSSGGRITAVGYQAAYSNTTGGNHTAIGWQALRAGTTGDASVGIGYMAGAYETAGGKFFVDNQDRTNEAGGRANSLLYGIFAASPASQSLTVNGALIVTQGFTVSGTLTVANIDSVATGGTDTISIGGTNADVINIGRAGATVNILGSALYEYAANQYVLDKLITLNYSGALASGAGVGFEIEENNVITGYFKTNAGRDAFSVLTPSIAYRSDISLASLTADRVHTLPDVTGTLASRSDKLSVFAATTSAELAGVISDETGSGALVFATSPQFTTKIGVNMAPVNVVDISNTSSTLLALSSDTVATVTASDLYSNLFASTITVGSNITTNSNFRLNYTTAGTADVTSTTLGAIGMRINVTNTNTAGTITNLTGLNLAVVSTGTGITTNLNNIHIRTASGTVVNWYGIRVEAQTIGSTLCAAFAGNIAASTGRYNFYGSGTAQNYFAGKTGIGVSVPIANLHTQATTEQLRVGYDASNYYSTTVGANGTVTFDAVGTQSAFVFNDPLQAPWGAMESVYYRGNTSYSLIADASTSGKLDMGTDDFSYEVFFKYTAKSPIVIGYLICKQNGSSGDGYWTSISTSNAITTSLRVGGTTVTSSNVSLTSGNFYHYVVTFTRTGNMLVYLNGVLQSTTSISALTASLDTSDAFAIATFSGATSNFAKVNVNLVRVYNVALTASEVTMLYNNGRADISEIPFDLKYASTAIYTSDFSAGTDGWANGTGNRFIVSGNNDGVSDGTTSYDNCLKGYADGSLGNHGTARNAIGTSMVQGKRYRVRFNVYIPAANTNLNGFKIQDNNSGNITYFDGSTGYTTTWKSVDFIMTTSGPDTATGTSIQINSTKNGAISYTGAGSSSDDMLYVVNFSVVEVGAVADWRADNATAATWYDLSTNALNLTNTTVALSNKKGIVRSVGTNDYYARVTSAMGGDTTSLIAFIPSQTKQTASRALNTTYTNSSTTRSIMVVVTVRCAISVLAGSAYVQAKSDGSTPPTTVASGIVGVQSGLAGEDNTYSVIFVVAPGMNYRVDSTTVNGTTTLGEWYETSF